MRYPALPLLALCALGLSVSACTDTRDMARADAPLPRPAARDVSFKQDVKPILDTKCLACHGCYDAPCQLKLETAEGLVRGAHPEPVYDGARKKAMSPTRLGIDEQTEAGWRARGFHSVLQGGEQTRSVLYRMLVLGKQHPPQPSRRLPDDIELGIARQNQCVTSETFDDYAADHPREGMPLAVTGLTDDEFALITGWLNQGARIDTAPVTLSAAEQRAVESWENFLNREDDRHRLVARWLFEHLFLAHLYFEDIGGETRFFDVVRSSTPPGKPVAPIATVRPNDAPEQAFFYRLRPVEGTLVHKRHITFALSEARMARVRELFFSEDWRAGTLPGYDYQARANPFITFAAIPARARYQFMLDEAEYFTRTFIRGPVCRGQIATDVIRDQFWTFFQAPDKDQFVIDADYQAKVAPLLGLPGQDYSLLDAGENWLHYRGQRNDYLAQRQVQYSQAQPAGAAMSDIWHGEGHNSNALLTIFRHHDSASVTRGLVGEVPLTLWLMDYPLFERTYYELVVNFDVFGNLAHQAQTRLYFDLIRNGAEQNFLRLMPAGTRKEIQRGWYQGLGKLRLEISYHHIDDQIPAAETYVTKVPQQEFAIRMLEQLRDINAMPEDPLNRCQGANCGRRDQAAWIQRTDQALSRIAATPAAQLPGILYLPEVTFVRVTHADGERTVYSLLRNRAHSNVAFMLGESLRYEPEKDTFTVFPSIIGSYPNFIFDVPAAQVEHFVSLLGRAEEDEKFERIVTSWGVRRTHPQFWATLHDFTAWQREHQPLQAGVFDVNRFENL